MAEIIVVEIDGNTYPVEIVRRKGKSLVVAVKENGTVQVRCSPRTSRAHILKFIHEKEQWIARKVSEQNNRQQRLQDGSDGEHAVWLGREYQVRTVISQNEHIVFEGNTMIFHVSSDTPQARTRLFYHEGGLQILRWVQEDRSKWDRDICIANQKSLPRITIKYTRSRWGSCTPSKPSISISVRLIHFPKVCFDYVFLHEYAHMLVLNHSKDFYAEIEKRMPEYKVYERLLKR